MAYTFKHGDRPLEGYTIQRAVGRGGFGEVYYAISDGGREVALKYLRDNPHVELRGVSNCINLKSPHLVSIFDVRKTADGEYVIIMEYCSGPSLRDLLVAEPNGFAPDKATFFAREIGKGLSYLHDRGIVHRDLKPGNIFYDDGYVKIGDYGLSKFISVSRHSAQTASVGTVHYMAPEIGSGDYSRGIDVYALGVMLFEMLRGRVPFEGSTMAEILMKHLTSQPEVDQLPDPFGRVIRKALEKDPRNRYATVDEMMDELLAVESIQRSLAGFSTRSLEGAVARGGAGPASPVPSPNPPRQAFVGARRAPAGTPLPLPERVVRKMEQVDRKIERKIERLGGRKGRVNNEPPSPKGGFARPTGTLVAERGKRIALSIVLVAGLSVALGVISGISAGAETGASAGMLIPLMAMAVGLSAKAVPWFGATYGPRWAQFMIRTGCAAPLLALGAAPVMASNDSEQGVGLWIGLLAVAVLGNWNLAFERARDGDVRLGGAIWTGFGALIASALAMGLLDVEPPPYMYIAAGVAFCVSVIVQASTWWAGPGGLQPSKSAGEAAGSGLADRLDQAAGQGQAVATGGSEGSGSPPYAVPVGTAGQGRMYSTMQQAMQDAMQQGRSGHRASAAAGAEAFSPRLRWGVTRGFWSIVSFVLLAGVIINFLLTLILEDLSYDDRTGTILGCIACAAVFTFAVRKTTPLKREGFWHETARPFLLAVAMFGIGGTITGISRYWAGMPFEEHVLVIVGLVASSLVFLILLFARGGRHQVRPFLHGVMPTDGNESEPNVYTEEAYGNGSDEDDSAHAAAGAR